MEKGEREGMRETLVLGVVSGEWKVVWVLREAWQHS